VRKFGHEVVITRDGPSALALAERFQPECAILDISLPGMSGIELGRRFARGISPRTAVHDRAHRLRRCGHA
jgi:CheY-like chemotaxis protein